MGGAFDPPTQVTINSYIAIATRLFSLRGVEITLSSLRVIHLLVLSMVPSRRYGLGLP